MLGEPLRAEIDIPEINADEAGSLKATVAPPSAYRAAGLEYNSSVANLQISLQRRADGTMYLSLSSPRAVNDPFIDLVLEANWASGRIVRDYTMLFDPPSMRQPASPTAPMVSAAPAPAPLPAPAVAVRPAAPVTAPASPAPARQAVPARPAPVAAKPASAAGGQQVTVHAGDTAGRIAAANKPASVSLDQMLVALLRANPEAFIGGNVNRLKSGAVLDIPSAEQASAIGAGEATQTVVAQSKDFNEFRRKLAEGAPATQLAAADRQAAGKLQARVEDKKPSTATPDKLTLSKGAVQAKASEDKIAKDRQAKEASDRVAELSKNITELNKLGTASTGSSAAPASPASAAPGSVTVPAGALASAAVASAAKPAAAASAAATAPVAATATVAAASAATAAAAPSMAASAAADPLAAASSPASAAAVAEPVAAASAAPASAPKPAVVAKPAAAPLPEPSFVDDLIENPVIPAAAVGLLALLGGFGFYRLRQRKKATQVDSSFLESRLQPDSFFGASGGQHIDTNDAGAATGSSMVYSPSQLDAAGDVDPVAEADVYLAYGRDLQAEEILKEAMRTNPSRVAIHGKLLEIYAKRRDAKAFELVATEAYGLTRGEGPEWERICELGHELDAANPMYRPGGQPSGAIGLATVGTAAAGFAVSTIPQLAHPETAPAPASADLDLDLDFSLGDEPVTTPPVASLSASASGAAPEPTIAFRTPPPMPDLDMDFDLPLPAVETPSHADNGLSFTPEPEPIIIASAPAMAPAADPGMLEFDLDSLSLDLGPTTESPDTESPNTAGAALDSTDDPLATKLALAQEFHAIGDADGARSLVQEVVAEASGSLKAKAQRFLSELG
ncbi:FimV/HubP family polar landmark protein [Variovorax terrae]